MDIEIDQSGKVERTNVDTIIAYSNHECKSICLPTKEKRVLQSVYRDAGKSHVFIYRTFAVLTFLLLNDRLKNIDGIVIDDEYPGWGFLIKDFLLQEIRKSEPAFDKQLINFDRVGKKSNAHLIAYETASKGRQSDLTVSWQDVAAFIVK